MRAIQKLNDGRELFFELFHSGWHLNSISWFRTIKISRKLLIIIHTEIRFEFSV